MGEDPSGGADEVEAVGVVGDECDHDRRGINQGHPLHDGGPAAHGALQAEEAEDAPEEALDGAALAEFGLGPGGRQAVAVLLRNLGD